MSLALAVLGFGRSLAQLRLTEQVTVVTRLEATNPETLTVATTDTVIYSGPAQVKTSDAEPQLIDAGRRLAVRQTPQLKVPVDAPALPNRALVTVTASDADAHLVSRTYRVVGSPEAGQTTTHRYELEEVRP